MNLDQLKADLLGDWAPDKSSADTTGLTLIGPRLLDEFRLLIERVHENDVPGDIVETGVWRGGASIWAAAVLENLGSDRRVYACDSFQGLPKVTLPQETISYDDAVSLAVPLEQVEANFARYGLLNRVTFVKGWFRDTMPTLNIPVAILRMDGDMFESTRDVLTYMYERVTPGGYIIVDDYLLPPCRRAVDEFRARNHLRGSLKPRPGVWWQKPPAYT